MEYTQSNKKLRVISLLLAILLAFGSFVPIMTHSSQKAEATKVGQWIFCAKEGGKRFYNLATTDELFFMFRSKSAYHANQEKTHQSNGLNALMEAGGYKFGRKADQKAELSVFDKYGFNGLKWTSYGGEWKYYKLDACNDETKNASADDYGKYYKTRLEPQATHSEIGASHDPRVMIYSDSYPIFKVMRDAIANTIFIIAQFFLAITLTLIGVALGDTSELIGLTDVTQQNIFHNLYYGLFTPLVVLMFVITACHMIYHGIIKRQIRQSLIDGVLKTVLCFFLATILAINPLLMTLPNKVATAGEALVISALGNEATNEKDICSNTVGMGTLMKDHKTDRVGEDDGKFLSSLSDSMRSNIGCRMYKELLFIPWMRGQFGRDVKFEDLESIGNENEDWVGKPTVKLGSKEVTNWAVFQLDTMSTMHQPVDGVMSPLISGTDKDWYRIVDATSNAKFNKNEFDGSLSPLQGFYSDGDGDSSSSSGSSGSNSAEIQKWLNEWGPSAKTMAEDYDMYASVMLAQMILEGGWGKSGIGENRKYGKNYFGVKCFNKEWGCEEAWTSEQRPDGSRYRTIGKFQLPKDDTKESALQLYTHFFYYGSAFREKALAFTKTNISSPEKACSYLKNTLKYATDENYDKSLMNVIKQYNLTQYDTPPNANAPGRMAELEKIKQNGGNASSSGITGNDTSFSGDISGGQSTFITRENGKIQTYTEADTTVTPYWEAWNGNDSSRVGTALISTAMTVAGGLAPFWFGIWSAIYTVALTMLMVVSPIFLLFGCWAGRGQKIFMGWVSSVLNTMVKKITCGFLMVLSVLLVTNAMHLLNEVGFGKSFITLLIISILLIRNKDKLLGMVASINLGGLDLNSGWGATKQQMKKNWKHMGTPAVAVGGSVITAKRNGMSAKDGIKAGLGSMIKNKAYQDPIARYSLNVYEQKKRPHTVKCDNCGKTIQPNSVYWDVSGMVVCDDCYTCGAFEFGEDGEQGTMLVCSTNEDLELAEKRRKKVEKRLEKGKDVPDDLLEPIVIGKTQTDKFTGGFRDTQHFDGMTKKKGQYDAEALQNTLSGIADAFDSHYKEDISKDGITIRSQDTMALPVQVLLHMDSIKFNEHLQNGKVEKAREMLYDGLTNTYDDLARQNPNYKHYTDSSNVDAEGITREVRFYDRLKVDKQPTPNEED